MGASEILQTLRKENNLTSLEIARKVDCAESSVKHALKRLLSDISEKLEFRIMTQEEKIEKYGRKLGCKIYIYWLNE